MKTVLSLIATLFIAQTASASHGVEKRLPADAHNITMVSAKITQVAIGSKPVAPSENTGVQNEGYPSESEAIFGSKLEVTFKYESDDSNAGGSGPDGQTYSWDDQRSTAVVQLTVPATMVADVKSGRVKARDLVAYSVMTKTVSTSNAGFGHCAFNYETGMNEDSNCEETTTNSQATRPVLFVRLK